LRRQQLKQVVKPIGRLARTAKRIAAGSLDERADAEKGLEVGELASAFNQMTGRLRQHIAMENMVAGISRRLMETSSTHLDAEITRSLGDLGRFVAADRCYLFFLDDGGQTMSNTHEWCAQRIAPFKSDLQALPVAEYPWLMQQMRSGADILIDRVDTFSETSATEKMDWQRQGIQSLLCVSIQSEGTLQGFVGFDAVHQERQWSRQDAKLLRLAGEIFYIAVQRRRSEAALKDSETRFRTLVEHAADAIFLCDTNGNLVDVNRLACESLGYTRQELLACHVSDVDAKFSSPASLEQSWAGLRPGRALAVESEHRRKDGTTFPVMLRIGLLNIGPNQFILGLAHDITERKRIEADLRESEARYRQLVQHAPAGIYEIDLKQMRFISVNDVMCTYTGYSRGAFLSLAPQALLTEDSLKEFLQRMAALTPDNPTPPSVEYRINAKNGCTFWVLLNTRFVFEDGIPVRATAVAYDMTSLRKAEEEKKRLEAKLAQIQKMESLGTLAGGIAHDFNNLLMGIQGNASLMLLDDHRDREDRERLTGIDAFVRRGVELTRQLLGLARGGKYEVKATDLNRLVADSATLFGRTKKEIHIHQHLQAPVWAVECDRGQIHQVLLNIFVNAWQAMPDGGDLFIATENTVLDEAGARPHGAKAGRYVKIAVTDSGTGMDPETMAKIFDPFFTTKERQRGTGLGLASAYGIVKNHDGIIDVSSRPGAGSTFAIFLPAIDKAVDREPVIENDVLTGSERILLVDDEPMVLEVGRNMLEFLGYRVFATRSGGEAVDIYRKEAAIDLVVLDMIMPGMSGAETFKQLKAVDPQVRVLLSSGYSIDGQAADILDQGCRGFIQKPFSANELSRKVREILDSPSQRPSVT
jgi:PAS domain S-box-containing protein